MSPYENRQSQETFRRVGLIALVRAGAATALAAAAKDRPAGLDARATNLHIFTRAIVARHYIFVFLEYRGLDVETVPGLLQAHPWFAALAPHLEAHPRAASCTSPWLRMELMNVIGPTFPAPTGDAPAVKFGLLSGLKPAGELWYRTLHQTNWPGVIDQLARSHYRYWVTFMVEFGPELMLFTYCEYVGVDKQADDAAMAADPVTQRWWTHTEPCLIPQDKGGPWTLMETILATT